MNTVAIGLAAGMGVLIASQVGSSETSIAMRIGSGVLAFVVTAVVAVGVLTLVRRLRK